MKTTTSYLALFVLLCVTFFAFVRERAERIRLMAKCGETR